MSAHEALDDIIKRAADERIDSAEVDAYCERHQMTRDEFADALSYVVATRYQSGEWDFAFCDGVMNRLYSLITVRGDYPMPPLAMSIFLAFDEGEYYHSEDSRDVEPDELYTRPMLATILADAPNHLTRRCS